MSRRITLPSGLRIGLHCRTVRSSGLELENPAEAGFSVASDRLIDGHVINDW